MSDLRFKQGDRVIVTCAGRYQGKRGKVIAVERGSYRPYCLGLDGGGAVYGRERDVEPEPTASQPRK